jgi:hypothetical protein
MNADDRRKLDPRNRASLRGIAAIAGFYLAIIGCATSMPVGGSGDAARPESNAFHQTDMSEADVIDDFMQSVAVAGARGDGRCWTGLRERDIDQTGNLYRISTRFWDNPYAQTSSYHDGVDIIHCHRRTRR